MTLGSGIKAPPAQDATMSLRQPKAKLRESGPVMVWWEKAWSKSGRRCVLDFFVIAIISFSCLSLQTCAVQSYPLSPAHRDPYVLNDGCVAWSGYTGLYLVFPRLPVPYVLLLGLDHQRHAEGLLHLDLALVGQLVHEVAVLGREA